MPAGRRGCTVHGVVFQLLTGSPPRPRRHGPSRRRTPTTPPESGRDLNLRPFPGVQSPEFEVGDAGEGENNKWMQ